MARITVEDCLRHENNRFALVHLCSQRTKQLLNGAKLLANEGKENKSIVQSLREIADSKVIWMTKEEEELQLAYDAQQKVAAAVVEPVVENGNHEKLEKVEKIEKIAAPVIEDIESVDEDEIVEEEVESDVEDDEGEDEEVEKSDKVAEKTEKEE